jgi:hypothetical protein
MCKNHVYIDLSMKQGSLLALQAYQGKDIVFTFIIEYYSSLRDFGPLGNNNRSIFIWGFLKDDILGLCQNLRLVVEL